MTTTVETIITDIDETIRKINTAEVAQLLKPASETGGPWTVSKWNYEAGRKGALMKVRAVLLLLHIGNWRDTHEMCPIGECASHGKSRMGEFDA